MRGKRKFRELALQRINRLFELAEAEAEAEAEVEVEAEAEAEATKTTAGSGREEGGRDRSERYVQLARKIGMRYRVRIPRHLKMRFCKNCHAFLIPGRNARVRLKGENLTTTCLRCGKQTRRPYKAPRPPSSRRSALPKRRGWS